MTWVGCPALIGNLLSATIFKVLTSQCLSRCGKGWRADSPVDMGGYTGADRCCRHHDLGCPLRLLPLFVIVAVVVVVDDGVHIADW